MPRQLANVTHAHPRPDRSFQPRSMWTRVLRGISAGFPALSPCRGQVAYALRTRAPVAGSVLLHPVKLFIVRIALLTFDSSRVSQPASADRYDTRYLLSHSFNVLFCLPEVIASRKRVQRYDLFPFPQNFFSCFSNILSQHAVRQR